MGKYRIQEIMASLASPLISFGSYVVVTIGLLQEFMDAVDAYIGENLWETITGTSTPLLLS